mmetsp:Transcript_21371/g.29404  ORF Transcript_21371/g.29404 Transcript_21371/m.29404 type:complete len:250 (+) Transcript_21371:48-797(+)|eukprot:CAMPEP_0170061654 /NCGR_PEP_ID=MMETSP0019_2-20121128/3148_1 /TAXON_ID=98059 /ORGANISM="Dinobryon sp., Strain UTEXLB2267" /LENGTH=249 /DNA_ID=CAMNT_0010267553 /DNA_START=48 /DNA_END=797 /DNA_ORIENTATION=+
MYTFKGPFSIVVVFSMICSVISFLPHSKNIAIGNVRRSLIVYAREKEVAPENETEEEQRERLKRKARKMMFNENGVAYAPWVAKQINEEAIIDDLIRKEGLQYKKKATSILDRGEIESSEGMKWRMSNNQVELAWVTGGETENLGYIVEKRPSYGGDFQEIASFNEVSQLQSKGAAGGRYRYIDPSSSGGSWIYRVKDCDQSGEQKVLCQCFVEVQTESESKSQSLVAAAFAAFFVVAMGVGYSLDPPL